MIGFAGSRKGLKLTFGLLVAVLMLLVPQLPLVAEDVPYVPTPDPVVDKMMEMARVQPGDYVIDLGSGDGRLVIEAAKRGAIGHGVEIDPARIAEARTNAFKEDVTDRVAFLQGDIFEIDFSEASVITLYLLPEVNRKLGPRLLKQLDPGTRIVSHNYGIGDWEPKKHVTVRDDSLNAPHDVYFWVVPARVDGQWTWTLGEKNFHLDVTQNYGGINADLTDGRGNEYNLEESRINGERLQLEASNGDTTYLMNGTVRDNRITGSVQVHGDDPTTPVKSWHAERD